MDVELPFGADCLRLRLPETADRLQLPADPPLADPAAAIRACLAAPAGSAPLAERVREKRRVKPDLKAAIVVSDNTRPVPYHGACGILEPVLDELRGSGVARIDILVATGTHRELSAAELRALLPPSAFERGAAVSNHVCTDWASLRSIGRTSRGTDVWINRRYLEADLKILTGLVEPHFMAGASGGPKAVCPGLVGQDVTRVFHGPAMMTHPRADSLVLDGNPCHEEALDVARMAGVDFIVNVTLNREARLTGVFAGDVRVAHRQAVQRLLAGAAIPFDREYDLALTHAGFVGINHYQAAKAAVEAAKTLRPGGSMILAANHTDVDPVGSASYRKILPLLAEKGVEAFNQALLDPAWRFVPDQWEAQMWGRAFSRLGAFDRLTYCSPQLTGESFTRARVPGTDGGAGLNGAGGRDLAERMVQRALDRFLAGRPGARVAVLMDGPYGVPIRRRPSS